VSPLFFEHEQRRSFGQRLLLASELTLELANAPEPCLASQLRCTHCVVAGEPLNHLLFESHGEWLGHIVVEFPPLRGSTSNDATTILAQGGKKIRHSSSSNLIDDRSITLFSTWLLRSDSTRISRSLPLHGHKRGR
jgi:hypothetical protein